MDVFVQRPAEAEIRTYLKWSDGKAMYDQPHRLASSVGPSALDGLNNLLSAAIERYRNLRILSPELVNKLNIIGEATRNTETQISGTHDDPPKILPHIKPPIRSTVQIRKRKKGFTENLNSKKKRGAGLHDVPDSQGSQRAATVSDSHKRQLETRKAIAAAHTKAFQIIEMEYD